MSIQYHADLYLFSHALKRKLREIYIKPDHLFELTAMIMVEIIGTGKKY